MTRARDLANTISPGTLGGLVLIKPSSATNGTVGTNGSVTFSAQTSVSLNDVFSTTYDNYRIVIRYETSGANGMYMRLRVSGSDNSSNNYKYSGYYNPATGASFGGFNSNALVSYYYIGQADAGSLTCCTAIDVLAPFLTEETVLQGQFIANNTSTALQGFSVWGSTSVTTSYTGFTILSSDADTFTGTISVYGYNK